MQLLYTFAQLNVTVWASYFQICETGNVPNTSSDSKHKFMLASAPVPRNTALPSVSLTRSRKMTSEVPHSRSSCLFGQSATVTGMDVAESG